MATIVSEATLDSLSDQLLNKNGTTALHTRFRALFTLKSLSASNPRVIPIIGAGFNAPTTSALLRHELAYVLGQIGSPIAIPLLEAVLSDVQGQEEMVRHECAEALAAIGSAGSVDLLRRFAKEGGRGGRDDGRIVRETCEIALAKIEWDQSEEATTNKNNGEPLDRQFTSVDPAPPLIAHSPLVTSPSPSNAPPSSAITNVRALRAALLDTHLQLFTRYRAMFALRNIGTPPAIDALCAGFDDDSALFKHEIAFILGQLSHPHSIPALVAVLQRTEESDMVRHEAAEALGSIPSSPSGNGVAGDGEDVLRVLREWGKREDAPDVVRDSCLVAVDMWEYENSNQFQYADGLEAVPVVVV